MINFQKSYALFFNATLRKDVRFSVNFLFHNIFTHDVSALIHILYIHLLTYQWFGLLLLRHVIVSELGVLVTDLWEAETLLSPSLSSKS